MGLLRIGNSRQTNEPSTKGKVLLLANFKLPLNFLPQFPLFKNEIIYIHLLKAGDNTSILTGSYECIEQI